MEGCARSLREGEKIALNQELTKVQNITLTEYSICVIILSVGWEVAYTEEFEAWWSTLSIEEQEEVAAKVELLEERGPLLSRPHADIICSSRYSNMKELRGKVNERHLRVLYAFDPKRMALLLIGGDKTDDPKWYETNIPVADDLFKRHLTELKTKDEEKEKGHG
jgi:hypothetical protein